MEQYIALTSVLGIDDRSSHFQAFCVACSQKPTDPCSELLSVRQMLERWAPQPNGAHHILTRSTNEV